MPKKKKAIIISISIITFIILSSIFCYIFRNDIKNKLFDKKVEIDLSFVDSVENIKPPTFPNNICNVSDYGAVKIDTKEKNNNVESFKKAIEDCSNKGGGIVKVPEGEWLLNGPIHLKSNINLSLEENSILTFSSNPTDYLPVVKSRYEGNDLMNFSPMIYMPDCTNVAITGKGTIQKVEEPNGWFEFKQKRSDARSRLRKMSEDGVAIEDRIFGKPDDYLAPSFIQSYNSKNVLIEGFTVKDGPPMWTIHPIYTENLIVRNLTIRTSDSNTDGIAIDSSENVLVENNNVVSGDDAIVIKSGRDEDGWRAAKPSQNIVIRNNVVEKGHGAVTIGSEMSGDVRNVLVEDLTIEQSDKGLRMKTKIDRGGVIENLLFRDILVKNSEEAMRIDFRYDGGRKESVRENEIPEMRNVEFRDIKVINNEKEIALRFVGLKNKISDILFKNIQVENDKFSVILDNVDDVDFENVNFSSFKISNSSDIKIKNDECIEINQKDSEVDMDCKK